MAHTKCASPAKLRTLGCFEEYAWLLGQAKSMVIVAAATIEGATTVEGWKTALSAVQARYPILTACIRKRPGFHPYFEATPGLDISLRALPFETGQPVLDIYAEELETPFETGKQLWRATVLNDADRSTLVLSAHHAAVDGQSMVYLIRDVMRALAGENLGAQAQLLPSLDELLSLPCSDFYTAPAILSEPAEPHAIPPKPRYRLEQVWLEPPVVAAMAERVRQERTTVHGAVAAAILFAAQTRSDLWAGADFRYATPMDHRAMLGRGDDVGLLITVAQTSIELAGLSDFWSLARQVREDVAGLAGNAGAVAQMAAPFREMLSSEADPGALTIAAYQKAYALMITNYGRLNIPSDYGKLRLSSFGPMVSSGGQRTQTVSIATFDGRLCMTNVSPEPVADFLADAKDFIIAHL